MLEASLATKQNSLVVHLNALGGMPTIDVSNNIRIIFGVNGVSARLYFNPDDVNDPRNNNIQVSFDSAIDHLTQYYTKINS